MTLSKPQKMIKKDYNTSVEKFFNENLILKGCLTKDPN